MAITQNPSKKALLIQESAGIVDGKQVLKMKRYSIKNLTATPEQIYNTGEAIKSLMTNEVIDINEEVLNSLIKA